MSLKLRLALLAGVLLAAFLGTLQVLRLRELHRVAQLQEDRLVADRAALRQWIDLTNQPLRRFVQDFARWPALADFLVHPQPDWAEENLRANLDPYEVHALWIVDADGRVLYSAQKISGPPLPPPLLPAGTANTAGDGSAFAESRDGLLQVWSAPVAVIHGSPPARLVAARAWNPAYLATLSRLADATVRLGPAGGLPPAPAGERELQLPLRDAAGTTLRQLVAQFAADDAPVGLARDLQVAYVFALYGALLVGALWLALRRWVLKPLDLIRRSLALGDPAEIRPLLEDRAELGGVARLVEMSFAQKATLQATIEQHQLTEAALRESEKAVRHSLDVRARLARDLHDGVIQSIYAAGLGLESAVAQFEKDPAGARTRLQLCRQSLNDVIREVRAFINGIEPEELHSRGFAHELEALARTMRALWPVHIELQVDPAVAARLNSGQEMHALHISRECVSNAVRHGHAREITIQLADSGGGALLRIRDNGVGFEPEASRGAGSGLGNLEERARELGGTCHLSSSPGQGTEVRVVFPVGDKS